MALSFFGKKPTAGPAQQGVPGGGVDHTEDMAPPRTELSSLNFGGVDANQALAQAARLVEVQESETGVGAACEEAAVLYANGDVAEAERTLNAVIDDPSTIAGDGLWLMLLDLYRLTGQKQRFEARVLDYATRSERSPPPWVDLSPQAERKAAGVAPLVNLSGRLSAQAAVQFHQIGIIGRKSGAIRIDLGRVRGADEAGCALLRQALAGLAADRVKLSLLNCEPLADFLMGQIAPGRAEARDVWLLLLELLQYGTDQERFENLAVDYAVTFEESPPSWEARAPIAALEPAPAAGDAAPAGVFRFDADLVGASNEALRKLAAYGTERREIVVDCARLRRVDFVCAGMLFNILSTLRAQGRIVALQNVNAMVGALLRVMSVDQVAHVTLRD